jgi:hypothetical protein
VAVGIEMKEYDAYYTVGRIFRFGSDLLAQAVGGVWLHGMATVRSRFNRAAADLIGGGGKR